MRLRANLLNATLGLLALVLFSADRGSTATPDHLVILSSSDMKGKTSPCGCHTPMGGLSRWSTFVDSLRADNPKTLVVVGGGFFPELADHEDVAAFYMQALEQLGAEAVGMSESELRFGLGFFKANLARSRLPMTCANLIENATGKPLLPPFLLKTVEGTRVGVFALASDKAEVPGSARDSVRVTDPTAAARAAVTSLRQQHAAVIVMLSSLGKVQSEDVATAVPGIDLVIAGHGIPMYEKGRTLGHSLVVYGGEQGQYVGRTELTLDAQQRVTSGQNQMVMLSPDVPDKPAVDAMVKAFEDAFNERQRKLNNERAAMPEAPTDDAKHFVGVEVCARCHPAEYEQWKTTPHATAWQTLVDEKKESTPDCIPCHVVGYQAAGGFRAMADAPKLGNVQCESCHGMGSEHDRWAKAKEPVGEATCRNCHNPTTSPTFGFALYRAHVLHHPPANLEPLPPSRAMMKKAARNSAH